LVNRIGSHSYYKEYAEVDHTSVHLYDYDPNLFLHVLMCGYADNNYEIGADYVLLESLYEAGNSAHTYIVCSANLFDGLALFGTVLDTKLLDAGETKPVYYAYNLYITEVEATFSVEKLTVSDANSFVAVRILNNISELSIGGPSGDVVSYDRKNANELTVGQTYTLKATGKGSWADIIVYAAWNSIDQDIAIKVTSMKVKFKHLTQTP